MSVARVRKAWGFRAELHVKSAVEAALLTFAPPGMSSIATEITARVELLALSQPDKPAFELPEAELIGWLDDRRLLVFRAGELLVVDAGSGATTRNRNPSREGVLRIPSLVSRRLETSETRTESSV